MGKLRGKLNREGYNREGQGQGQGHRDRERNRGMDPEGNGDGERDGGRDINGASFPLYRKKTVNIGSMKEIRGDLPFY